MKPEQQPDSDRRRLLALAASGAAVALGAARLAGAAQSGEINLLAAEPSPDTTNHNGSRIPSSTRTLRVAQDASAQAGESKKISPDCPTILAHSLRPLVDGTSRPLCERYPDHVLLIVNTASECGFTPQFEGLQTLAGRYENRKFQVLGFPSADFDQELEDEAEVARFCELNYGVTFPMFQKISVAGETAHPLYRDLAAATDGYPLWNFNKYLVDREGHVLARYNSSTQPLSGELISAIEAVL